MTSNGDGGGVNTYDQYKTEKEEKMSQPQVLKVINKYGIMTFPLIKQKTGLSKSPLRDAIMSLECQGEIKSVVYRGRYKVYMSLEVYEDLFKLKCPQK